MVLCTFSMHLYMHTMYRPACSSKINYVGVHITVDLSRNALNAGSCRNSPVIYL
jgi:hypothetical protein